MFKKTLAISSLALLAAGCASKADPEPLNLTQSYRVISIGEQPVIEGSNATLKFIGQNRAGGTTGCNNWTGNFKVDGESIRFNTPFTTRKMCLSAYMEQEQNFLKTLESVRTWRYNQQQQLELWPNKGQPITLSLED